MADHRADNNGTPGNIPISEILDSDFFQACVRMNNFTLMDAVRKLDLFMVKVLIHRVDVNALDQHGFTALHLALRQLIHVSYKQFKLGRTLTEIADICDRIFAIILCLAEVADVTIRNPFHETPFRMLQFFVDPMFAERYVAAKLGLFSHYHGNQLHRLIDLLLTKDDVESTTAHRFLYVSIINDKSALADLLIRKGIDVTNVKIIDVCRNPQYFLHVLSQENSPNLDLVAKFSKNGMLNSQDTNLDTALHIAVLHNSLPVLQELKRLNADRNIRNARGLLPIECYSGYQDPQVVTELLDENMDLQVRQSVNILFFSFCSHRTEGLKDMLLKICERMPSLASSPCELTWKLELQRVNDIFLHFTIQLSTNPNESAHYYIHVGRARSFLEVLSQLPVKVTNLYACSEKIENISQPIEEHLKKLDEEKSVLLLSDLCRRVVRRALCPVRGYKVDKLNLPYCLKQFILQADIAEKIYTLGRNST